MKKSSLTNGSIYKALLLFSLPIIITNTVNILFHAADVAVLAFFAEDSDVAAVGAVCGFGIRCFWRYFIWPINPTLSMLFACYAVSAFAAIIIYLFVYRFALKKTVVR